MPRKPQAKAPLSAEDNSPYGAFGQLQQAGMKDMIGAYSAWFQAINDMTGEVANFVMDRFKKDAETQAQVLQCRDLAELQVVQAAFVQDAANDYQAVASRLINKSKDALETINGETKA